MRNQLSLFFIVVILLQSCRVYHVTPVPIEEAVSSERRVKIHMIDGTKLRFKKVIQDSNQFYGVKRVKGEMVKSTLKLKQIEKIRLHNKPISIVLGVVTTFVIASVAGITIILIALTI